MERKFKKIQVNFWKPEEVGDQLQGTLVKKEEDVGANNSKLYGLETDAKKQMAIWGGTVLDELMNYISVGDFIRVTYKGLKPVAGKNDMKLFEVEKDETEPKETEGETP